MLHYVLYRTRTKLNRSFLELIFATDANGGGLDYPDSITLISNAEQTASAIELHSPAIRGIPFTLVSEQSTEFSKGHEVVSSRFQMWNIVFQN